MAFTKYVVDFIGNNVLIKILVTAGILFVVSQRTGSRCGRNADRGSSTLFIASSTTSIFIHYRNSQVARHGPLRISRTFGP